MNENEVERLLAFTAEVWPNYPLPDEAQLPYRVAAWMLVLDGLTQEEAMRGIVLIARDGADFPPPPGQIVARLNRERELALFDKFVNGTLRESDLR